MSMTSTTTLTTTSINPIFHPIRHVTTVISTSSSPLLSSSITSPLRTSSISTSTSSSSSSSSSSSHRSFSTAGSLATLTDAYEILDKPAGEVGSRILLTAEHAQVRLPEPYTWPDGDAKRLIGTHWSYDPGTEDLTRELYHSFGSSALLSRFSRLLIDPNRDLNSDTLIRTIADQQPVLFNQQTTPQDRARRISRFYEPYHTALRSLIQHKEYDLVLSIHSFTPVYEGQPRSVEIGVLYCHPDEKVLAEKVAEGLSKLGYACGVNIPWSGLDGFMFAASTIAEKSTTPATSSSSSSSSSPSTSSSSSSSPRRAVLMFEFRQDLLIQPVWRAKLKQDLVKVLEIQPNSSNIGVLKHHQPQSKA